MATQRYKTSPGDADNDVVEETGAATNSDTVELTVDVATTEVNLDGANTRAISKQEVLDAIDRIKRHIVANDWPPA